MSNSTFLKKIKDQLIVSTQAVDDEPLNHVTAITLMAKAVISGGAKVLRLSQYKHIKSISQAFPDVPKIGLIKKHYNNSEVIITATKKEIDALIELKVNCIALDATLRQRPKESLKELVEYIKNKAPHITIMGDCSNYEDVAYANEIDIDLIGTTLRGYTQETKNKSNIENNYEFIRDILKTSKKPIIAEGGIWDPKQVKELLELGCFAVVVGSAITRPQEITKKFLEQIK